MPNSHDIIDNRSANLVDNIRNTLKFSESAKFAVGYFFLSGFQGIADRLKEIKELRLLIGNTTNRETIEQLAEGYRRLDLIHDRLDDERHPKRTAKKAIADETAFNFRESVELMDQTEDQYELIVTLAEMIEQKRLKVKVYTRGRLHAKAYIFDYDPQKSEFTGTAIVGSSNLSLSGIQNNTELNVRVTGNNNHEQLVKWFSELWKEAEPFDKSLFDEIKQSWALAEVKPYDIYMKTLYHLVRDRIEEGDTKEVLWDDELTRKLADFQKVAVKQAVQILKDYGGCFVSDVVGLGKSFIGSAIVNQFHRTQGTRAMIICPASLKKMWNKYNQKYDLGAYVVSMGMLRTDKNNSADTLLKDAIARDRNFVLIDESHNLRHSDTQRYKVMEAFLASGRRCCLLTATPRNKSADDIYHQIKLFHQDDTTTLPIDPPNLRDYFKLIEKGDRSLPDLLSHLLIRRTRSHILRWYGYDSETHNPLDPSRWQEYADGKRRAYVIIGSKHQFFPKRNLETIEYSIEDTYQGLYQDIRGYIGKPTKSQPRKVPKGELTFARYGLWHYVKKNRRKHEPYASLQHAGQNLRGLIRILLFKRFESSVYAFRETVKRLLRIHKAFLKALDDGYVPAGEDAQKILYESDKYEERDLMDALRQASQRYEADDFHLDRLREHIEHDIGILDEINKLVRPITPDKDAKLQTFFARMRQVPMNKGKLLIFTQYADTAKYLFENLEAADLGGELEVIFSGDKSKDRVVERFSPKSNEDYVFQDGEKELDTVVATDVLAEGLNMQDCDKIVNYDLHWNPVRLIQRFGRIDRIGSENDVIYGFNFLPETGIEQNLSLKRKLKTRIEEIHETIGEDAAILDPSEQLNEEALYAIYEKKSAGQLSLFEEEEDLLDLNEAEEIVRQMMNDDPKEFDRIKNLRHGIRTGKFATKRGYFVFCEADFSGSHGSTAKNYQQLYMLDGKGNIVSREASKILGMIKCGPEQSSQTLPKGYNQTIMGIKSRFTEEVKNIVGERRHTTYRSPGQRYVMRELQILFRNTDDEDMRGQINILQEAFSRPVNAAIRKELNIIRNNALIGKTLMERLSDIYFRHSLSQAVVNNHQDKTQPVIRIICSEFLKAD